MRQLVFQLYHWFILNNHVFVEELNDDLRDDVEILLIVLKKFFYQIVYKSNHTQVKLSIVQDESYFKYLLLHYLLFMYIFFLTTFVKFVKVAFKLLNMSFDLVLNSEVDSSVLPPVLALFIKFFKSLLQKYFIAFTQIFNIGFKQFFRSRYGEKSISIVLNFKVANPKISHSKDIVRFIFNCIFIALDCFIIIPLININVPQIVVRVSIPGVYLIAFLVKPLCLFNVLHILVYIGHVVINHVAFGIYGYRFVKGFY